MLLRIEDGRRWGRIMDRQGDLFATATEAARPGLDEATLAAIRAQLHATLALVQAAPDMPWDDHLTIIHQDNGFRAAKKLLPAAEGEALWAAFDAEMERLYAVMNARLIAEAERAGG